jgi:hypothetical protein
MAEELLDLIDAPAGVQDVAGKPMTQRMRVHCRIQTRAAGGPGQQFVYRGGSHRRANGRPEQVHEHDDLPIPVGRRACAPNTAAADLIEVGARGGFSAAC